MGRYVVDTLEDLRPELHRLAHGRYAPSTDEWDRLRNRDAAYPAANYITTHYPGGWRGLVRDAGLTLNMGPGRRKPDDPLGVPLTDDEAHAVALCGRAATAEALGFGAGLPVVDRPPRQLPDGRFVWTIR